MIIDFIPSVTMDTYNNHINGSNTSNLMGDSTPLFRNESVSLYDSAYVYDVHYRAKMILSRPQNILILILGTIAIVTNVFSILAISKICHAVLTSHFRLILNLAISDVLIGFSLILFLFINAFVELYPVGEGPEDKRLTSRCLFCFSKALNNTGLAITLFNLLAMAVDHYVAIMRPLHYTIILNRDRSIFIILTIWTIAIILGFSDFFTVYPKYSSPDIRERFNVCEFIHLTKYSEEYPIFVLSLICLVSMLFIYIRIYLEVKKHRARTSVLSTDLRKNKKAIVTTLLILGSFILCWLPMSIFTVILVVLVHVNQDVVTQHAEFLYKVDASLFILLLLNVIADPIIYAIRVKEVQFGYKRLFCPQSLLRHRSRESCIYVKFKEKQQRSSNVSKCLDGQHRLSSDRPVPMMDVSRHDNIISH